MHPCLNEPLMDRNPWGLIFRLASEYSFKKGIRISVYMLVGLLGLSEGFCRLPDGKAESLSSGHFFKESLENQEKSLGKLLSDIQTLDHDMTALIQEEHHQEGWKKELQETVASLKQRHQETMDSLQNQQGRLTKTLGALRRLSTDSPLMLVATTKSQEDLVHTILLLRKVMPYLKNVSNELQQELCELNNLRDQIAIAEASLTKAALDLDIKKQSVEKQLFQKKEMLNEIQQTCESLRKKMKILPGLAPDLKKMSSDELPKHLDKLKQEALGSLVLKWPARGKIVSSYGPQPDFTEKGSGILLETPAKVMVRAPVSGKIITIEDTGFSGYRVVLDAGKGYHVILQGLETVKYKLGRMIADQEVIGQMDDPTFRSPKIYIEIKRFGRSINPLPYFRKERE